MLVRSDLPPSGSARSNPGSNGGRSVRVDMTRTAHQEKSSPASVHPSGTMPVRDDPATTLRLKRVLEENEPDLALLVREREPNYNDLLRERISWREFYTPLGALFEQHVRKLMRERDAPTGQRAWNGRLPK